MGERTLILSSGTQEIYMGRLAADARAANAFEDAIDF